MGNGQQKLAKRVEAYYTTSSAPNPQLVDIFAREKGLDLSVIEKQVDLGGGENRAETGDHIKRNPAGQVPYLTMKDGSVVAETIAICELLEELAPKPPLIGATPEERASTRMWQRRMEEHYVYPAFTAFRFWTESDDCEGAFKGFFKTRAPVLIPEAYKKMQEWAVSKLKWLEGEKKAKPTTFICGEKITVVDIQVFTTLDFFADKSQPFLEQHGGELPWVKAWFTRMSERQSVKDCKAHIKEVMDAAAAAAKAAEEAAKAPAEAAPQAAANTPAAPQAAAAAAAGSVAAPKKCVYFGLKTPVGMPMMCLMEMGGFDYEGKAVKFEEWNDLKPTTPTGVLPYAEMPDGSVMSESGAIARVAAVAAGIDEYQKYLGKSEMLVGLTSDLNKKCMDVCPTVMTKDSFDDAKKEAFTAAKPAILEFLAKFEGQLLPAGDRFTESGLTFGEVNLFCVLSCHATGALPEVATGGLKKFYDRMAAVEGIKKVLDGKSKFGELNNYLIPMP